MKIFGREVTLFGRKKELTAVDPSRTWWTIVREQWAGAWQRNLEVDRDLVVSFGAVYACVTLIASDVAKMRVRLVERTRGIWSEVERESPYWPVLRKPNSMQNRLKFFESWVISKLLHGNTYVLKRRDNRGMVIAMWILDPTRVRVLVSEGAVFYELQTDNVTGVMKQVTVPASEIIHDTMCCLFHPLVGVSPIFACGLAATQGLKIQNNSGLFFQNMSRPSGVLTAPASIAPETAERLKEQWNTNFSGDNIGKVAVLGDGLKYEAMSVTAKDAELIEQLKWTANDVCTAFHVPPYKVAVGQTPTYANAEILNQIYYSDCLQSVIESIELALDEGLGLTRVPGQELGTEFDLHDLLRMDTATQYKTLGEAITGGIMKPNEARARVDLPPVAGGNSVYLQQQNFSLEALAKRDAGDDPFRTATPAPSAAPPPADDEPDPDVERRLQALETRALPPPATEEPIDLVQLEALLNEPLALA